jgi:chloramphenicol 3-O phosphotransferase
MDRRALYDAAACFAPIGGWFIGVKPSLEVSERWEAQRGDRPRGQARRHYDLVHAHGVYDLIVDPSQGNADACAHEIMTYIATASPEAFAILLG